MKDALSGLEHPADAQAGDRIELFGVPGYHMTVHDAKPCETDFARPEAHKQYKVTDPEGNEDWLCGWDVRKIAT
jgi:hypothetical protein